MQRIVNHGDTVLVIEHNLDVIKNADYIAESIGKNSWFVNIKLIDGYESWVGLDLIQHGIKLNIITGQRFGVAKH